MTLIVSKLNWLTRIELKLSLLLRRQWFNILPNNLTNTKIMSNYEATGEGHFRVGLSRLKKLHRNVPLFIVTFTK